MTSMDLFIPDPTLEFEQEKRANAQLDENIENWPRQILVELYRQLPSIAEYSPRVMMMKTDEARGTAFGCVVVASTSDSALSVVRAADAKQAIIPVIVQDYELKPLDILLKSNGVMVPLTEQRLREALFRPATFELITNDFGDGSLYNMFYPPGRSGNDVGSGFGQNAAGASGVQTLFGRGMKTASFELLESLGPTLLRPDLDRLSRSLEDTPGLLKQAAVNTVFLDALREVAKHSESATKTAEDVRAAAAAVFPVHVVQMGYAPAHDAYWVKQASRDAVHPVTSILDRGALLKFAGEEIVNTIDTSGTVTVSVDAKSDTHVPKETWKVVTEPGIYRVKDSDGIHEYTGWVLPSLRDPDGVDVPMAVFTNGAVACVQDQIVGHRVATGVDLPSATPQGTGIFYATGGSSIVATVPLAVMGSEAGMNDDDSYIIKTLTGEDSRVRIVPGTKNVVTSGGEYFMPSDARFLSLDDEKSVTLLSTTDAVAANKEASLLSDGAIDVIGNGESFQLHFHGLPKLASVCPRNVGHDEALFVLCLAGVSPDHAISKLASCYHLTERFPGRDVTLLSDRYEAAKLASVEPSQKVMALRQHLIKEAAVMPDVSSVDALLSLGFINSENVQLFVSRIPYLEKALSMVCELVLGSRLGMTELPEQAGSRAARGLDSAIQGLKSLMLRQTEVDP